MPHNSIKMTQTPGIQGYAPVVQEFTKATQAIKFEDLHRDFLQFIPTTKSLILDIGAGIGRDAHQFSAMGHTVVAVEPLEDFRVMGKKLYPHASIQWVEDSLPALTSLKKYTHQFDFILASGVWHHLPQEEQTQAMCRVSELLKPNGKFAVSLRNGPAGAGIYVFPTNTDYTIEIAKSYHLSPILKLENQPSLMKHKKSVRWSRLLLQKTSAPK